MRKMVRTAQPLQEACSPHRAIRIQETEEADKDKVVAKVEKAAPWRPCCMSLDLKSSSFFEEASAKA